MSYSWVAGPDGAHLAHVFHLAAPLKRSQKRCTGELTPQFSDNHFGIVSHSSKMSNHAL